VGVGELGREWERVGEVREWKRKGDKREALEGNEMRRDAESWRRTYSDRFYS
jgi:hypothetical protein